MAYTYLSEYETNICALGDHKTRVSELRTKEVQNQKKFQMGGKRGRVKEVDLDDNGQAVSP